MIRVQTSLFPMETANPDEVIKRSVEALKAQGMTCDVGPVSTEFTAEDDAVWQGLREAFEAARAEGGEVAMTVTITNSEP